MPRGASGHAVPRTASPAADATVATGPSEVSIRFSERVERRASALEVLDASGRRVDRGDARVDAADPWLFRVGVPDLGPGVYTVSWRVLSADDGHLTEGAHGFVVGEGAAAGRPAPARVRVVTPPLLPLGRWLALAGVLAVLGVTLFGAWLGSAAGAARARRVALLAGVGVLALGEGLRLAALLRQTTAASFLATGAGRAGAVELVLTIALAVLVLAGPRGGIGRALTITLAVPLLIAGAFAGHGAAAEPAFLAVTAHALHLVSVAAWVGGLGYFATLFWAARRDAERLPALAAALPRFSLAATAAVGGLALTGLYLARLHLTQPRELITTRLRRGAPREARRRRADARPGRPPPVRRPAPSGARAAPRRRAPLRPDRASRGRGGARRAPARRPPREHRAAPARGGRARALPAETSPRRKRRWRSKPGRSARATTA